MKKLSAIFLLSVYLLSTTGFSELLKVNVLVEHYNETTIKDGPVSFIDFLVMHYITDDGTNKDDDRDSQLPFRSHSSMTANNGSNFILNRSVDFALTQAGTGKRHFYNYTAPFISSNYCNLVWNPPKMS